MRLGERVGEGAASHVWQACIVALVGLFPGLGCSDVITSNSAGSSSYTGLAYALPMGQVLLQASRTQITAADVKKAQATVDQANAALQKDTGQVTAAGADATKLATAQTAQKSDQAALDAAKQNIAFLNANLGKWQENAVITVLSPVPDPTERYVADMAHSEWRDDNLKLSVVNGLLTTSTAVSTDQTPNILVTIADTAITALTLAAPLPVPKPTQQPNLVKPPVHCNYSIAQVIDPLDNRALGAVDSLLASQGSSLVLYVNGGIGTSTADAGASDATPSPQPPPPSPQTRPAEVAPAASSPYPKGDPIAAAPATTPVASVAPTGVSPMQGIVGPVLGPSSGLFYRIAAPVVVQVQANPSAMDSKTCPLATFPTAQSVSAIVPDTRSQFMVGARAGWFTTTNLAFGFSSGMLTDYGVQRPSEIAAAMAVPLHIANDLMQIPTQVLQARVNYDNQATALINASAATRAAQIQQAASLATAQTAVVNAQTALLQAQIGQPAAVANAQTALLKAEEALKAAIAANAAAPSATP